jgi:phospholipid transport system transporter-binding protein
MHKTKGNRAMPNAKVELTAEGHIKVSGVLYFTTVADVRDAGVVLLGKTPQPVFDLQSVTHCDSSALALLTAWAREARRCNKQARFIHVPEQLMDIIRLSSLEKVLELS